MNHTLRKATPALAIAVLFLAACNQDDAKTAWSAIAKDCAVSDLNGRKVLFFGPSNVLGPGSIWREASTDAGGGYRVRWDSNSVPDGKNWSKGGGEFACQGNRSTKLSGGASAGFASDMAPLSVDAKADFEKAKSVEVKASMLKWDLLVEGPFEQAILGLPANNAIKQDLAKPGRLVMYRALKVRGFEAKLTFDTKTGAELQGKYKDGVVKSMNGELGAGLNFRWVNEGELIISAPADFYVAGELVRFDSGGGFASAGKSSFSEPIDVSPNAKLSVETPN